MSDNNQSAIEVVGIDPGTTHSGIANVLLTRDDDDPRIRVTDSDQARPNGLVPIEAFTRWGRAVVVEDISNFGQAVGRSVFETVKHIGVLQHRGAKAIYRKDVKLILLGRTRGTDSEIAARVRQIVAVVNGCSDDVKVLKGRKASRGPLYGLAGHAWQAAAVAIAYMWQHEGLAELYTRMVGERVRSSRLQHLERLLDQVPGLEQQEAHA